jgi:hypothetical protein
VTTGNIMTPQCFHVAEMEVSVHVLEWLMRIPIRMSWKIWESSQGFEDVPVAKIFSHKWMYIVTRIHEPFAAVPDRLPYQKKEKYMFS